MPVVYPHCTFFKKKNIYSHYFHLIFTLFHFHLGYQLGSCPKIGLQGLCGASQASCCSFFRVLFCLTVRSSLFQLSQETSQVNVCLWVFFSFSWVFMISLSQIAIKNFFLPLCHCASFLVPSGPLWSRLCLVSWFWPWSLSNLLCWFDQTA